MRPGIGVAVIVVKDGKVLMGKRKNILGSGEWAFPGGHLEFHEKIEDCAKREVYEETGLIVKNIRVTTFTNDIFVKEKKHYITLFTIADYDSGKVELKEHDKCELWEWFDWDNMPEPLYLPVKNLLKQDFSFET